MRLTLVTVTLALLLSLFGCGFHLRGQTPLPKQIKQLGFQSDAPYSLISIQLEQALKQMGVKIIDSSHEKAPLVLKLGKDNFSQISIGTGATNQLTTYSLTYNVSYQLLTGEGKVILPERTIIINRSFTANNNQMLGSSNEQTMLQQDIRREAIAQLFNQLHSRKVLNALK